MAPRLDEAVSEMLEAYARELRRVLAGELVGAYMYGSVALGAYEPGVSDVDVAVLHSSELTEEQLRGLGELHARVARRYPTARKLDVSYVPVRLVGTYGDPELPFYRDGRFSRSGGGDVNPVMWHTLRLAGIAVCGPPPERVAPPVSRETLDENMRRNLAFLAGRMPSYTLGGTEPLVFGVLSLCRVLHTLRTGEVAGKLAAAGWALGRVEPRWRPLIERAMARYRTRDLAGTDPLLTREAGEFAAYINGIAR